MANIDFELRRRMLAFDAFVQLASLDKKEYQYKGVEWCVKNELNETAHATCTRDAGAIVRGGIIADDMGLGKTIIMIGLMCANSIGRTLIVLPVSLVKQWEKTILTLTGVQPLMYYGSGRKHVTREQLFNSDVVITTYTIVSVCLQENHSLLHSMRWKRIIYDEGHHLRNWRTNRHIACDKLTSDINWIVTGTPIQNRINDLFSLCSILKIRYSPEVHGTIMHNYVLKRTKLGVGLSLPSLSVVVKEVHWSNSLEKEIAMNIHESLSFTSSRPTQSSQAVPSGGNAFQTAFANDYTLSNLMRARQSCIMPQMLVSKLTKIVSDHNNDNDSEHQIVITNAHKNALQANSKIAAVVADVLARKLNGAGKLIFCHYIAEIDEIRSRLIAGGINHVSTYDGRNSRTNEPIDLSADVLILQIQTGCEGINLQDNYSEVYFVSPHWNPSVEDQAIARCHRIGQVKPVHVFKFVMEPFNNTTQQIASTEVVNEVVNVEYYINNVQNNKRHVIVNAFA